MNLTALADCMSEHPEELMTLGVLLGLAASQPAQICQLLIRPPRSPRAPPGASTPPCSV
jgi:hypothetical protein